MIENEFSEIIDPREASFQRRNYEKIKLAYRILVVLNLIIDILMIVFFNLGIVNARWFYFTLAMLPMDLYLFAWIFHEVVSWGESKSVPDTQEHIYLGTNSGIYIQLIIVVLFVLKPQEYRLQCTHGVKYIYYMIAVIFAFLFLTSLFTIRKQKGKLTKCIIIAMLSIGFSWGLTDAIFSLACSRPSSYFSLVYDSTTFRNRGTYYRVKVLLEDGTMEWFSTTEEVYDEVGNGAGVVVIYDRTSLFNTEFIDIRLPKQQSK